MRVTVAREGTKEPLTAGPRRTPGAKAAWRSGRRTPVVRGWGAGRWEQRAHLPAGL